MPDYDFSSFEQLKTAVNTLSPDELVRTVEAQPGGIDGFLDTVFAGMASAFNPAKAAGQSATVQYDIGTPEGTKSYWMQVAGGACTIQRGAAETPRATLKAKLPDLLRLITGKLNPAQALMTRKLSVSGDLFFLQTMQGWFDRPDM
jgi:putative sterol carrier protein